MYSDLHHFRALNDVTTATLTTVLLKKGLRNVWMRGAKPLRPGQQRIVGRAFTLRFVPAREDLATPASWGSPISTRAAIEAMPNGCVTVVDAMGVTDAGIFGDILCARMEKRGVGALITDGVVRDVAGILSTLCGARCSRVPVRRRPDGPRLAGTNRLRRRGRLPQRRRRSRSGRPVVHEGASGGNHQAGAGAATRNSAIVLLITMSRVVASKARKYGKARRALKAGRSV